MKSSVQETTLALKIAINFSTETSEEKIFLLSESPQFLNAISAISSTRLRVGPLSHLHLVLLQRCWRKIGCNERWVNHFPTLQQASMPPIAPVTLELALLVKASPRKRTPASQSTRKSHLTAIISWNNKTILTNTADLLEFLSGNSKTWHESMSLPPNPTHPISSYLPPISLPHRHTLWALTAPRGESMGEAPVRGRMVGSPMELGICWRRRPQGFYRTTGPGGIFVFLETLRLRHFLLNVLLSFSKNCRGEFVASLFASKGWRGAIPNSHESSWYANECRPRF